MSTFNITSSALNNSYNYKDESVTVQGSYTKDATTSTLQNISGTVYTIPAAEGQQGEYIGNFNGYMRDGEIRYSISEMSRRNASIVWSAIDEIETYVTNEEEA